MDPMLVGFEKFNPIQSVGGTGSNKSWIALDSAHPYR